MSLLNAVTSFVATGTNNNGGTVTLPAGTARKLLVGFTTETTTAITALTYNGVDFLSNLGVQATSVAAPANSSTIYWYDVPDETVAGNYNLLWNQATSTLSRAAYVAVLVGAELGEPAWENGTFLDGTGTGMSFDLTSVSDGAFVFAIWQHSASSVSVTWGASATERFDEAINSSYRSSQADADNVSAGTKTISTTASASDTGYRQTLVAMAVSPRTIPIQNINNIRISTTGTGNTFRISQNQIGVFVVGRQ